MPPFKKIRSVLGLMIISLIYLPISGIAQCIDSNPDISNTSSLNGLLGQSFVASCNGSLQTVKLLTNASNAGLTLGVFEGDGTGGTLLGSVSSISFSASANLTDYKTIDLSGQGITLTSGDTYTFAFTSGSPQSIVYDANASYTDGQLYFNGFPVSGFDMVFEVETLSTDPQLSLYASTTTGASDDEDGGQVYLVGELTGTSASDVDITFTYGGTATIAADYTAFTSLTITAGDLKDSLLINYSTDAIVEGNETIEATINTLSNAIESGGAGTQQVDFTIQNDDAGTIAINDVAVTEGNSGSTTMTFTATLTGDVDQSVTVDYATSDGSATTADSDYNSSTGTLTFDGNDGEQETFTVTVNGDSKSETNETLTSTLSNIGAGGKDVTFSDATGQGTINNDDTDPTISIDDVAVTEGNSGTTTASFTVSLSAASGKTITVDYATSDNTATTADGDYDQETTTTLTFNPGETSKSVDITVNGDSDSEADETYFVDLSNPVNATISDNQGEGTITNDDSAGAPCSIGNNYISNTSTLNGLLGQSFVATCGGSLQNVKVLATASNAGLTLGVFEGDGTGGTLLGSVSSISFSASANLTDYKTIDLSGQGITLTSGDTYTFAFTSGSPQSIVYDANASYTDGQLYFNGFPVSGFDMVFEVETLSTDPQLSLYASTTTGVSDDEDGGQVYLVGELTGTSASDVDITFTYGGTATISTDYTASTSLTITAGDLKDSVLITYSTDAIVEGNETIEATINTLSNAIESGGAGTQQVDFTIQNDDAATIAINDVAVTEGNSGSTTMTFTATLTGDVDQSVTVDYATSDGSATTADSDYNSSTGTLTFDGNDGEQETFTVTVNGDSKSETNETLTSTLSNIGAGGKDVTFSDATGQGTINNDDADPTISIDDVAVTEGNSGTTTASFTVSLSAASGKTITVDYATSDNTATTADGDYDQETTTTLTLNPGETSKSVDITVNGDSDNEPDETYFVDLSNPVNATISDNQGEGTITNDDNAGAPCSIGNNDISNTSTLNGLLGQSFVATCGGSLQNVKVLATASNAGLTLGVFEGDGTGGTLLGSVSSISFSASANLTDYKTIDLSGQGITLTSGDTYTFAFTSGSPQSIVYDANASYTDGQLYFNGFPVSGFDMVFEVETLSTDPQLSLYASTTTGASDDEDGGQVYLVGELTGTSASDVDITFTYGGTATISTDYTASTSLTITAGDLKDSVLITYSTDAIVEGNETIEATINTLSNAIESGGAGTQQVDFTIQNDDAATIAINDVAVTEGNSGSTTMTFTATLTGDVDQSVTVDYATSDGSGTTADSDYNSATGTLTFDGNDGEQETFNVTVNGDSKSEINETLTASLSNIGAGGKDVTFSDATGQGTINNDDTDPTIGIDDVAVTEGNSGSTTASFTVSLSAASGKTITVDYATSDNTATAADGDYDQETTTTITFNPGETSKSVDITINGDTKDEANETFNVDLSNPTNATISDNQGVGTINNDDTAPTISIDDVAVTEGNSGSTTASFTVSLSAASGKTITVDYATSDNTATAADGDYDQETTTTITFNPGETSKSVDITINGDTKDEANETFNVDLSNPTNATISDNQGVGTINNDDTAPTISIDDVAVTEGNSGTTTASFTVSLSAASGKTITVDYATSDNTATTADGDYDQETTTTLTFNPGETSKSVDITVNGDTKDEANETFNVDLSNPTNATISDNQGVGTINNNDTAPTISIDDVAVTEGNSGTTTASFTVSLIAASGKTITVDYATSDNTATTADGDYDQETTTTLTFNPGETSKSVDITVNGDVKDEANETFNVDLSNPTNATISDNQGTGTINNDDTAPTISIDDVALTEGNSGTTTASFTVSLSAASGKTITVDYATSDNTATTADGDYDQVTTTTLTFNPGETSKSVDITVNGDAKDEVNETFNLDLNNPTNATISDNQGTGTINNDDTAPTISIDNVAVTEGNSGTTTASFTVSLNTISGKIITVDYATGDNIATVTDSDYNAIGTTTLTFNPGETSKTVDVTVNGDTKDEVNESFHVDLTNPTNATISDGRGVGLINNDDTAPAISIDDVAVTEGNSGATVASFTVSLDAASGKTISVEYETNDNLATTSDGDYDAISATILTFNPGETSKTVDVTVNGDTKDEVNESFHVDLTNPTNATISDGRGIGLINDDDAAPLLSINDIVVTEGNTGTTTATFTVSLNIASGKTITFDYVTVDNSATVADGDYNQITTTPLTLNPGETSLTIDVQVNGDTDSESDELFLVTLSNSNNASINDNQGECTILDDDTVPSIIIGDAMVTEGNAGTVTASFNVSLDFAFGSAVTVDYSTSDNTATTADSDYDAITTTTLTFNPGETSKTVSVTVNGDSKDEDDESFFVDLSNPTNATITDNQGEGTITNDDAAPGISIDDVTVSEGNSGTVTANFTVSLDAASGKIITVDYSTSDNTATTSDSDYDAIATTTLTFNPGETSKTVSVTVNGDGKDENDESFFVDLSNPTNATITDNQGEGSITNDDSVPTISIDDVTVTEGNSGTVTANFTVTLDAASGKTITVDYSTSDNTATTSDSDYDAIATTTLTFNPGETSKTVSVTVNGDGKDEDDETFFVDLSNPTNATITDNQGEGTITNDDTAPAISIDDVTVTEGNSGTVTVDFTVSLDAASGKIITVDYSTSDNTATTSDSDYDAIATTTLTFNPGETSKTVSVTVNGDGKDENDESFFVDLSNPTNATITDNQGEGSITNDDSVPAISIDDVTVTEGNSGTVTANFTVTLDAASGKTIAVDYSTSDNTATDADGDYDAIATTTLSFNPGETAKTVSVTVNGDIKDEDDESFFVDLSNPTNATITDNQGQATITNDDSGPGISIDDVKVTEGNSGTVTADFTVSLDAASGKTITVDYSTSDNTATIADGDYNVIATTTLTFNPGETSKSFSVTVNGDLNVENDESFFVDLTNAVNASISDNQGIGTISNDESGPQIAIGDATVTEGNTGSVSAIFTVTLDASSASTITVDYTTSDNTASSVNGDYDQLSTTTLTFNPGETSQSIEVFVNGDLLDEEDESFFVDLSNASNATIVDNQAEGTITDDDDTPSISIDDVVVTEGNSGTTTATFTISLDSESGKSVSVDYTTSDNTATSVDADYDQIGTTTLTFAAGETSKTIDVTINGDETEESDESFFIELTNAVNASIADNQGEATIEDDDAPALPELSISDVSVTEGSGVVTINVNLSAVSTDDVTVDYTSATNTAEDQDFVSGSGSLTILAGETSASFEVTINNDDTVEIDESFFINLSNVVNATIIDSQAEITIENDDSAELSISDSSIEEGDESSNMASFVITLSNPSDFTVEVDVQSVEGSANSGTDYITFNSQTITFEPGETSKNIEVEVNGDLVVESDETFTIELSNSVNATIADNSGTGTIEDDDIASIGIVADIDGEEGTSNGQITIFSDRIFEEDVTIEYELGGTAVVGEDFEDFGSSVILPKNAITVSIPITILEDNIVEETETIVITLLSTNNSKANIGSSSADELAIIDNDSNPIITAASFSIAENTSNGTSVGTLTASDDSGTSFSGWEIIGGNSDQDSDNELPFSINASTGEILVNDSDDLDRESISEFDLEVIVSDGDNESSSAVISISISDVNDVNPIITAGQSFTIAENQASASSLGFLLATDGDITETTFTDWEIINGNDLNIFSLSGSTGELFISSNVNLDFENNTSHTLEISVQDGENTSETETVLITVTNVNDNNPIAIGESYTLNEDEDLTISSPGLLENDSDFDGDDLEAVLVTTVSNGTLNLNADGSFYYLPNPDFNGTDSFVYTANDGGNNSEETTVEITVSPINDSPTITSIADITASENQVVGPINFTLSDVDHAASELIVEISADNNNVFTSENVVLSGEGFDKTLTLTPTDFASGVTVFTIDVTDGDFEISESFTVTVTNDITAPTDIILDVTEIDEDVAVGFVIGTIQTEDTDLNDEHIYTLVEGTGDDNNSQFEIDGNELQVAQPLDFEENEFVSIRIKTTDLSGLTFEKVFEFDIIPNPELELDIPTTFTPNGDMINDTWDIDNILIHQDAKVTVFSTEGTRVFESIGYEVPWDGTYQGNELPVGTYYYIIELSGSNLRQYKGFVMILK